MEFQKHTPDQHLILELAKALMITEFPVDRIPERFKDDLRFAMNHASIGGFKQHGFGREIFNKLRDWAPPISCAEMHLAINIVKASTPEEMNCEANEDGAGYYDLIQDCVEQVQTVYDEVKEPIEQAIRNKINALEKASLNVPIGKEIFKKSR